MSGFLISSQLCVDESRGWEKGREKATSSSLPSAGQLGGLLIPPQLETAGGKPERKMHKVLIEGLLAISFH